MAVYAWDTIKLLGLRSYGHSLGENEWSFDQILPILLTTLLLWSMLNTVYGI